VTLGSYIVIVDPVDARALFDFGVGLLGSASNVTWEPITHEMDPEYGHGWSTQCGQGLASMFDVEFAADGPLRFHDPEWMGPDEVVPWWDQHCVSVRLDTAYGYRGPNGSGCGDVHLWLIREIGRWLDDRPIPPRGLFNLDMYVDWIEGWQETGWGDADRGALSDLAAAGRATEGQP
jgi:hypothetical protein